MMRTKCLTFYMHLMQQVWFLSKCFILVFLLTNSINMINPAQASIEDLMSALKHYNTLYCTAGKLTIEGFNLEGAEIKAATFNKCITLKNLTKEEVIFSVIDNVSSFSGRGLSILPHMLIL